MLKKTTSFFLIITLVLSLFSVTAFGAMPTGELTCTTAGTIDATSTGTAIDNFDHHTRIDEATKRCGHQTTGSAVWPSDIFDTSNSYNIYTYTSANNPSDANDKLMKVSNKVASATCQLKTLKFYITENYVTELSYNVRFPSVPTSEQLGGNTSLTIFGSGFAGEIQIYRDATAGAWKFRTRGSTKYSEPIVANKLYTVRKIVDGTTGDVESYLLDGETGEVLVYGKYDANYATDSTQAIVALYMCKYLEGESELNLEIDNAKLVRYDRSATAPAIAYSSIANGATGINPAVLHSIDVVFDQAVTSTAATLKAEGADDIVCTVTPVTNKLNTYTVSWEGELAEKTVYTLDMSATTNGKIVAGYEAKIAFTTKAPMAPPVLSSSTIANGSKDVDAATKSVEIAFDSAVTTVVASLKAEDGTEITTAVAPVADKENTYTVSWTDDLALGTTYTLDLSETVNADGVKAGDTETISFTIEKGIEKLIEDFANGTVNGSEYTGNILKVDKRLTPGKSKVVSGGYKGGTALQLTVPTDAKDKSLEPLVTKETYTPEVIGEDESGNKEYEKFVVTYRFNLKDMADVGTKATNNSGVADAVTTAGSRIHMSICSVNSKNSAPLIETASYACRISTVDGKPVIHSPQDDDYVEFKEDHWYNIVCLVDGANQYFKFIDTMTGKLLWERSFTLTSKEDFGNYGAGDPLYVAPYVGGRTVSGTNIYNHNQIALIQDFSIWRINPYGNQQKLKLTNSNDGAELDIDSTTNNKITLTYNQPILGTSPDLEVYKVVDEENELAYSTANIKYADFCTQEVTFSNLDYLGEYALDYSAMEAVSGAEIADAAKPTSLVKFTTMAAPQKMSIVGDISCTGQTAGSEISFDLYSKEDMNDVTVITGFYDRIGKLLGSQTDFVNVTAGAKTPVEVTVKETQDADYIKIFVWNNVEDCTPLSKKYDFNAPVDTLDVLLIGSSLSEDAGRFMDEVAKADNGFDLNVTVVGIGGSNFTHHADNIREELGGRTYQEARDKMDAAKEAGETVPKLLYWTYLDGVLQTTPSRRLIDILQEEGKKYDVISLQQAAYHDPDVQEDINLIAETIRKYQPQAEIIFYQTWAPYNSTKSQRSFYFENTLKGQVDTWAVNTGAQAENVMLGGGKMKIFPAGKAFYLADNKYDWCGEKWTDGDDGDTESEAKDTIADKMNRSPGLWRDYNHASYYGCYLANAVWYEMLTGRKAKVGTEANPAVPYPENIGITKAEHIERLEQLSDIAHQAVLEQK